MRKLTGHKVNDANNQIEIEITDDPGSGGANHRYEITGFDQASNLSGSAGVNSLRIVFQNGPIKDFGVNGITQEVLLEIVADRLRSFQSGPYSTKENAVALTHIETAQLWLHKRTLDRISRGVEGTHNK